MAISRNVLRSRTISLCENDFNTTLNERGIETH